jgi:P-type Cu+ transporter
MQMSLGTSIAYFASIALLTLDATSPPSSTAFTTTYFDSVVFLTFFVISGRYLEAFSRHKTANAVTELGKLRPTEALLLDESNNTQSVSVDMLEAGDKVLLTVGSSPPNDGTIISGSTKFDESSLTGEAQLVPRGIGDQVFAGTINKESVVTISIEGVNGQSM